MHVTSICRRILALVVIPCALAACGRAETETDAPAVVAGAGAPAASPSPSSSGDLEDRVEQALAADTVLREYGLDADDDDGSIVLKGAVRSVEHQARALQVATLAAGATAVENRIRMDVSAGTKGVSPLDVDDAEDLVEDAFEADSVLRRLYLEVDEEGGALVLEGKASSPEQRAAAEALARRVAGNIPLVNRIRM